MSGQCSHLSINRVKQTPSEQLEYVTTDHQFTYLLLSTKRLAHYKHATIHRRSLLLLFFFNCQSPTTLLPLTSAIFESRRCQRRLAERREITRGCCCCWPVVAFRSARLGDCVALGFRWHLHHISHWMIDSRLTTRMISGFRHLPYEEDRLAEFGLSTLQLAEWGDVFKALNSFENVQLYTVSEINVPPLACYKFDTCEWILIFFGRNVTDKVSNQKKTFNYTTSINFCFCTTQPGKTKKRENCNFLQMLY